ncbi:MAG TPA: hypothetical protein VN721_17455 [Flavipsychrobacter sp.]|nr:hypothetical protein [Flavipsychrobacter sp.]
MKRFTSAIVCLACICAIVASCDTGAYNADPINNLSNKPNPIYNKINMDASINNVYWKSSNDPVVHLVTAGGAGITFTISGSYGNDTLANFLDSANAFQAIAVTIYNYKGPGTYLLNKSGIATYIHDTASNPSLSGQIVVSSDDGLFASGTYNFTTKKYTVTSGNFYAPRY